MRKAALIDISGNPVIMPGKDAAFFLGNPVKTTYNSMDEWRDGRSTTIGGSEAPAILGLSPYMSALELFSIKAGLVEPDASESEVLEWGQRLEEPIVKAYEEKTGRKVTRHGIHTFRSPNYPLSVSLDGEIAPINDTPGSTFPTFEPSGPGVLEIKTTAVMSEEELQSELPIQWQIQVQHAMAVTNFKWASIAIFMMLSRKFRYIDVERNEDFIQMLMVKELMFLRRIENNDPPDPDGSDSAADAIKKLFPRDTGEAVKLPDEARTWDRTVTDAKAEIKRLEALKTENENKLKAAIGENTFGVLPGGGKYSWKLQHRDSYYVKETEFRVLRRMN